MSEKPKKERLWNALKYPSKTEGCYFCSEKNIDVLEWHHILPTHGLFAESGGRIYNMQIHLCANCHRKLHRTLEPVEDYFGLINFDTKTEEARRRLKTTFWILSMLRKGQSIDDMIKTGFPEVLLRSVIAFLVQIGLLEEDPNGSLEVSE